MGPTCKARALISAWELFYLFYMSATHNPVVHCLDRLNLGDDPSLRARAESIYGQCAKVPTKIFDMGPNCRPVVAIQLACESMSQHQGWDTKLAAQLAGCTKRQYENTVSTVRKSLNLQPNVSLESLAVAFGCTTMLSKITRVWDDFGKEYLSSIPRAQRTQASHELNDVPAWKGALFFTCAKTLGVMFYQWDLYIMQANVWIVAKHWQDQTSRYVCLYINRDQQVYQSDQ